MTSIDISSFRRKGYAVVRKVFDPDEAETIRQRTIDEVTAMATRGAAWVDEGAGGRALHPPGDMLTYEWLRAVLLDQRLISTVAAVLGGAPAYFGESSVVVGAFGGARAWHTDAYGTPVSRGRSYPLVRCGLYLQDITRYSGGLALRPWSHPWSWTSKHPAYVPSPVSLVESQPGDLVIWDMRLAHAGEIVRLRHAPRLGLPLSLQGRIPTALRMPEERQRVVMFPTFGLPGPDLDSYLDYQRGREYMQTIWRNSRFSTDAWSQAESAGLRLIRPVPEWGPPTEPASAGHVGS